MGSHRARHAADRTSTAEPARFGDTGRDVAAPAGLAPDDATAVGRVRRGGLRPRPFYAAVSATVIGATAAVAASTGPFAVTTGATTAGPVAAPSLAAAQD